MKTVVILAICIAAASAVSDSWKKYEEAIQTLQMSPLFKGELEKHESQYSQLLKDDNNAPVSPFNDFICDVRASGATPTSVHKLRPGDIKVVGAMGDSLTAGNGINAITVAGCLIHYRGYSWSIGGQEDTTRGVFTLPNMLKNYNSGVTGYSTGTGGQNSNTAKLNVAEAGNVASDMPYQAQLLIERMQSFPGVNYQEDWKMVTLFIGGNDLCDYCYDRERYSVENYVRYIRSALDLLQMMTPRTIVNVAAIFDISPVAQLSNGIVCNVIHWAVCNCGKNSAEEVRQVARQYADAVEELIESGRYDTKDDFTVVYQPFMRDNDIPRKTNGDPDLSYFAPDCFHFSRKGQYFASKALFNSLFQPVGQKETTSDYEVDVKCPASDQYISTRLN